MEQLSQKLKIDTSHEKVNFFYYYFKYIKIFYIKLYFYKNNYYYYKLK